VTEYILQKVGNITEVILDMMTTIAEMRTRKEQKKKHSLKPQFNNIKFIV